MCALLVFDELWIWRFDFVKNLELRPFSRLWIHAQNPEVYRWIGRLLWRRLGTE